MVTKIFYYIFRCDCCGFESDKFYNIPMWKSAFELARSRGWAISRDRLHCYCPNCAVYYRHSGKMNILVETPYTKKRSEKK